jgi:hypothetical protein
MLLPVNVVLDHDLLFYIEVVHIEGIMYTHLFYIEVVHIEGIMYTHLFWWHFIDIFITTCNWKMVKIMILYLRNEHDIL